MAGKSPFKNKTHEFFRPRQLSFEPLERRIMLALAPVRSTENVTELPGAQEEPGIAINPTNPLNIIAVFRDRPSTPQDTRVGAYYSFDGGVNWTPNFIDETQDGFGATDKRFDANVAFDSDGNAYVVYSRFTSTRDEARLLVAKSTDGGMNYPRALVTVVASDMAPTEIHTANITTREDPSGADDILVVWSRAGAGGVTTEAALSVDGGASFPIKNMWISDTAPERTFLPSVTPDIAGNFHVVWEVNQTFGNVNSGTGVIFHDVLDANTLMDGADAVVSAIEITDFGEPTSTIPAQPDRGIFSVANIEVDRSGGPNDGRIYVSYTNRANTSTDDTDIFVRYSDADGAEGSWSPPIQVNDDLTTTSQFLPRLTVDQFSGDLYAVWYDARNDIANNQRVNIFMSVSQDGGLSWQTNLKVTEQSSNVSVTNPNREMDSNPFGNYREYIGLAPQPLCACAAWTDARDDNFTAGFNEEIYVGCVFPTGQSAPISGRNGDDNFELRTDPSGRQIEIRRNGDLVLATLLPVVDNVVIGGLDGDDRLVIDFANGNPIPAGGLSFAGQDQTGVVGDSLEIRNATSLTTTYTFTGPGDGTIDIDGSLITFTGLEPIVNTGTANDIVFNLPDVASGGPNDAVLENDAANPGRTQLRSASGTFELTSFVNPTNSLTINAGDGDDMFSLDSLDAGFGADIEINGGAGADVIAVSFPEGDGSGNPMIVANGQAGKDAFTIGPSESFAIQIDGGAPMRGDSEVPPGDVLALETLDVLAPLVAHSPLGGNGIMTSLDHKSVSWESIETFIEPDRFELNDSIDSATVLGSLQKITLRDLSIVGMGTEPIEFNVDVFLLFDDTGSFTDLIPQIRNTFPQIIANLTSQLPGASLAFGVGRFEDYRIDLDPNDEFDSRDLPFILNQPVIASNTSTSFANAISDALSRSAPGTGQGPQSGIEALFQVATGLGYDGNGNSTVLDNGNAGRFSGFPNPQTDPNDSGDVPGFGSYAPEPPELPAAGALGGVGFRIGATPIIIVATDTGPRYFDDTPGMTDTFVGANGATVSESEFLPGSNTFFPAGQTGATIQQTVDALDTLGARVVGLGTNPNLGAAGPRDFLEALATLTGTINNSSASFDSGIVGDPILPGEPLYFVIDPNSANNVTDGIISAATAAADAPVMTDIDVFKYTAQDTGKLIVNALFDHDVGNLDMRVLDMNGNVIAESDSTTDNEKIVIPVVTQEMYFIQVFGVGGAVNNYSLEIENFPAPVPSGVVLDPTDDDGISDTDDITSVMQPRVFIQADLSEFADMGIPILNPGNVEVDDVIESGAAVEVFVNGISVGFASPVNSTNTLFQFDAFELGELTTQFAIRLGNEFLNLVSAAVRIFDGQRDGSGDPTPATGRSQLSLPLELRIKDTLGPQVIGVTIPDMLLSVADDDDQLRMLSQFGATLSSLTIKLQDESVVGATGLAIHPVTGEVFALLKLDGQTGRELVKVDPRSGRAVSIGDTGDRFDDLAFGDDGTLYAVTADNALANPESLFFLDLAGTPTLLKPLGAGEDGEAIGFHPVERLIYHASGIGPPNTDEIFETIDPTVLGDPPQGISISGLGYDGVRAMTFSESRGDFLISTLFPGLGSPQDALYSITDTGVAALIGGLDHPASGLAVLPKSGFNLFNPKPSAGPTPLATSLEVSFRDLFSRDVLGRPPGTSYGALDQLIAKQTSHYRLVGDHVGVIPIDNILVRSPIVFAAARVDDSTPGAGQFSGDNSLSKEDDFYNGQFLQFISGPLADQARVISDYAGDSRTFTFAGPFDEDPADDDTFVISPLATATVELQFSAPLADDRYTLTVFDSLRDPEGNRLDGESNAEEPSGNPSFPSGDGVSSGNFIARFTVDSRPELGSYVSTTATIDINGNFVWDPNTGELGDDFTNVDLTFTLPLEGPGGTGINGGFDVHDLLFAGNFAPISDGVRTDGYDKLAAYGAGGAVHRWIVDTNNDGVVTPAAGDIYTVQTSVNGFNILGAVPVAGNFDGNAANGDEVGLYYSGVWGLDGSGDPRNFVIEQAELISGNMLGHPIVGDFNGDGVDDLAVFNNNRFSFDLDRDAVADYFIDWGFPGVLDLPVAADMNQDGIDDIGLWVPRDSAQPPREIAEWFFLISSDIDPIPGTVNTLDHPFKPVPFGDDLYAVFGDESARPIVGNFDPVLPGSSSGDRVLEACLTVTTTADSGQGSLRGAIDCANSAPGTDIIVFDIPGAGPHTIAPQSALPGVTDPVILDATTQQGFFGSPLIEVDGSQAGASANGVVLIDHSGSTIRGLVINNFEENGILIDGGGGHTIAGNFIGTDVTGTVDAGNRTGVTVYASPDNLIGGGGATDGNLISGNRRGILIDREASTGNVVAGNLIGTDITGNVALGNDLDGVKIDRAPGNTVGGTTESQRNLISGNNRGVFLQRSAATDNDVIGNLIGTNALGDEARGNLIGVLISGAETNNVGGSVSAGQGNLISGNKDGIRLIEGATGNVIEGNRIGTDALGTAVVPNTLDGIRLVGPNNTIGSTDADRGNLISGNVRSGILISSTAASGNTILGNLIGTSATGDAPLGNGRHGVFVFQAADNVIGGTEAGAGNVIGGNAATGVRISDPSATGNRLEGNSIGVSADGLVAVPNRQGIVIANGASRNKIGGTTDGAGNSIAHNAKNGVTISSGTGTAVQRNSIFNNGDLGNDLGAFGATPNDLGDGDSGANQLQNTPVLTSVLFNGADLDIEFVVDSTTLNSAYDLTVEFFIADSSSEEGETFLGEATYAAASAGNALTVSIPVGAAGLGTDIVATTTDAGGNTSEFSAPVAVSVPLTAAGERPAARSAGAPPDVRVITSGDLSPIIDAAIDRLVMAGFASDLFENVKVSIADLPGATLGLATPGSITLDVDAAGHGWFVDATPLDDSEFFNPQSEIRNLKSIDLLTVVMHELGHVAGLDDLYDAAFEDDVMYGWLEAGVRKTSLASSLADAVFAGE